MEKKNPYRKVQGIGQGEFSKSRVWRVEKTDDPNKAPLALKTTSVDKGYLTDEQVVKEAAVLKQLRHPNIVRTKEIFTSNTDGFQELHFIMELCDTDLQKVMEHYTRTCQRDALSKIAMPFADQMAKASQYLFQNKIIHREIKPSHILIQGIGTSASLWPEKLQANPVFKLSGFGSAKALSCGIYEMQQMSFMGWSVYRAPEIRFGSKIQAGNKRSKFTVRYNALVDAWSLGMVLLELCLGEIPMTAQDHKYLEHELAQVENEDMQFIIGKLLVLNPENRDFLHEVMSMKILVSDTITRSLFSAIAGKCYEFPPIPPFGHVLIINSSREDTKNGTKDIDTLTQTFSGFQMAVEHCQGSAREMKETVWNFLNRYDLVNVFIVIMSHGNADEIYGADGTPLATSEVLGMMNGPNLRNKFKMILVNACRGEEKPISKDGPSRRIEEMSYSDMIVVYSTIPGFAAHRDSETGSFFIRVLCEVLNDATLTDNYDIHALLSEVSKRLLDHELFAKTKTNGSPVTGAEYRVYGMSKSFYFPKRNM